MVAEASTQQKQYSSKYNHRCIFHYVFLIVINFKGWYSNAASVADTVDDDDDEDDDVQM